MAYPGSDAKNGLPLAPSNGSSDGASVTLTPEELKAYHAVVQKLSAIQNMRQAVDSAGANVYWDFKAQHARPGRIWQDHVPDEWRSELERDYTPEEMQAARDLTGIDKATPVPDDVRPRCVFLLGPPGAGKSTCLPRAAVVLNVTLDNSVTIDGDDLRSCHAAWVKRIDSDPVNGYSDSFQVFKKAQRRWRGEFDTLKIQLTTEAQKQRKNVIICDTKANKQVLENFRSMNYEVIVIGLLISQKEWRPLGGQLRAWGRSGGAGERSEVRTVGISRPKQCAIKARTLDEVRWKFAHPNTRSRLGPGRDLEPLSLLWRGRGRLLTFRVGLTEKCCGSSGSEPPAPIWGQAWSDPRSALGRCYHARMRRAAARKPKPHDSVQPLGMK